MGRNRPFVVRDHRKDTARWTEAFLIGKLGQQEVSIAVVPDGAQADAIVGDHFVEPLVERMTIATFFERLKTSKDVHYLSSQNGNLSSELSCLLDDIGALPWANEALQSEPEAVNLWVGNSRSVTSMHADPSENVYTVLCGRKIFTLLPPTEAICLYKSDFKHGRYARSHGEWTIEHMVPDTVPWIPVDPAAPNLDLYPRFQYARPMTVELNAGDLLYLPALWYHRVAQEGDLVIATNSWFDLDFSSPTWTLSQACSSLARAADEQDVH